MPVVVTGFIFLSNGNISNQFLCFYQKSKILTNKIYKQAQQMDIGYNSFKFEWLIFVFEHFFCVSQSYHMGQDRKQKL